MLKSQYDWIKYVAVPMIKYFGVPVSDDVACYIGCQFALESAYGTSISAQDFNNITGMSVPRIRLSTAYNIDRAYAGYDCIKDCVLDYILWLCYNCIKPYMLMDLGAFQKFLQVHRYNPNVKYIDKINDIYKSFKNYSHENKKPKN